MFKVFKLTKPAQKAKLDYKLFYGVHLSYLTLYKVKQNISIYLTVLFDLSFYIGVENGGVGQTVEGVDDELSLDLQVRLINHYKVTNIILYFISFDDRVRCYILN